MTRKPLTRFGKPCRGQGMIEYAGAMIIAAAIVAVLVSGLSDGNWMYNAYDTIFTYAGDFMAERSNEINE